MAAKECDGVLQGNDETGYNLFRTGVGGFTQRLLETRTDGVGGHNGLICYTTVQALQQVRFRLLPTIAPAFWRQSPPTRFGEDDLFDTQFSLHTQDEVIVEFFADENIRRTLIAAGKVSVELRPYGQAYALVVGRPTKPRQLSDLVSLPFLLDQMLLALGEAGHIETQVTLQ